MDENMINFFNKMKLCGYHSKNTIRDLKLFFAVVFILMGSSVQSYASEHRSNSNPAFAGSGSNLGITRVLAKTFMQAHPGININIPESIGSTGGIRAAAEGAITVGLVSRPLKEQEDKLGLEILPYARTAIVIGAHPGVTDDGVTFEELVQIYKGNKNRWHDGKEIIVYTREPGDSAIEALIQIVPGFADAYRESRRFRRWITLFTDQEMYKMLSGTPYAIGLSDYGAIKTERLKIKVLKLNGIYPNAENVLSGKYPVARTLSFVFMKDKLPSEARDFINFVLSKRGKQILKANGYLPAE